MLRDADQEVDFYMEEMNEFGPDAVTGGSIHQQTTRLWAAVEPIHVKPWSVYSIWLEETTYAHAPCALASKYAHPHGDLHMSSGYRTRLPLTWKHARSSQTLIVASPSRGGDARRVCGSAGCRLH